MSDEATNALSDYLDAIKTNCATATAQHLSKPRTRALAEATGAAMLDATESAIRHLPIVFSEADQPACGAGCAWCCYGGRIDVTVSEAAAIAAYIRDSLPDEAQVAIRERIAAEAAFVRANGADASWKARTACPLLDVSTRTCVVYPSRPAGCQGWTSSDAEACKTSYDVGGEADPSIPFHTAILGASASTRVGHADALAAAGLESATFELSTILDDIMNLPESVATWITGSRFSGSAVAMSPRAPSADEVRRVKNKRKRDRKHRNR